MAISGFQALICSLATVSNEQYTRHLRAMYLTDCTVLPPSDPNRIKGLTRTRGHLSKLIQHLIQDCKYQASNIFLFGFSQGGTVALDQVIFGPHKSLGGVVSISGYLLEEQAHEKVEGEKFKGNILVTQGDSDSTVGSKQAASKKVGYCQVAST
jgi:predicted esterase